MTSRSEENSGLIDIPALMEQMRTEAAQQRPIVIHLTAPVPVPTKTRPDLGSPIGFVAAALAISLASNAFALAQIAGPFVFASTEPMIAMFEPTPTAAPTIIAAATPEREPEPEPLALLLPALEPEVIRTAPRAATEPSLTPPTAALDPAPTPAPDPTPELEPTPSPLTLAEAVQSCDIGNKTTPRHR